MAGCSDFLDQKSPSELTTDEAFKSASFTQLAVNKLYGLMTDNTYGQIVPIIFGTNTDCELIDGLGGEASNTTSERGNMNYNFSPSWKTLNTAWDGIYDIINNCNSIIDGINQNGGLNSDDAKIKKQYRQFMGEALTVRAMCYLDLVRLWGDVPFKTTFDNNGSAMYSGGGKVDRDIILDALILDLRKATEYLYWAGESVGDMTLTTERVTKGYAYALLSEVALTRAGYAIREAGKDGYENLPEYSDATYPTQRPGEAKRQEMYKLAAEAAYFVINDSHHKLNPSFANEWEKINQLILDTEYRENMFEIPTGCGVTGELGYSIGVRINGATPYFGEKGNSSGKVKMTGSYWASFHNTGFNATKSEECWVALDTRRDVTVYPFQIRVRSGRKIYNVTHAENIYYEEPSFSGAWALYCGKWNPMKMSDAIIKVAQSSGDAKWATGINVVRMRYSKVLLNYAEACFNIGGKDYKIENGPTALEALEQVHTRAYEDANKSKGKDFIDNIVNTDGFMEALYSENAWEFAGEGVRKYDLIRWGQLSHKILKMKTDYLNGVTKQLSQGGWPRTMYYLYKEKANPGPDDTYANLGKFDTSKFGGLLITVQSSYCWGNGWPQYPGDTKKRTSSDCQSSTWFGTATENDRTTYLPFISAGLNPWDDIQEVQKAQATWPRDDLFNPQTNMTVKNRYILPIGSLTISDSNGTLKNSYGY